MNQDKATASVSVLLSVFGSSSVLAADVSDRNDDEPFRALVTHAAETVHLRTYLLDRSDTTGNDPGAWAGGSWLGYETDWIDGFHKLGAVEYTSQRLWAPATGLSAQPPYKPP